MIRITLETNDYIDIELSDSAPISTNNFLKLVREHYYDNCIFHRIIKDFMAQAGGYYIDNDKICELKDVEPIKGEFRSNGVNNELKHTKGVISYARTSVKDSATSQFFICFQDCPHLDGEYASFGKIVGKHSFETLEKLNNTRTEFVNYQFQDFPYPYVVIKEIREL